MVQRRIKNPVKHLKWSVLRKYFRNNHPSYLLNIQFNVLGSPTVMGDSTAFCCRNSLIALPCSVLHMTLIPDLFSHYHGIKSVRTRIFFWSVFYRFRFEYGKIRTRKNSVFGHYSHRVWGIDFRSLILVEHMQWIIVFSFRFRRMVTMSLSIVQYTSDARLICISSMLKDYTYKGFFLSGLAINHGSSSRHFRSVLLWNRNNFLFPKEFKYFKFIIIYFTLCNYIVRIGVSTPHFKIIPPPIS